MRILCLTNLFPNPFQPNRAPFNRDKFNWLAKENAVRIIAPILWTDELQARRCGAPPLGPARRSIQDGLTVEHPCYWYTPWVLRQCYGHFFEFSVRRTFRRAVAEFRPEIVLATWAYPDGWAAVRLARKAGLPVVIQTHGSDVLLLDEFPTRRLRTMEALCSAQGVVAVSQDLASKIVGLGANPENVRVVRNGVNCELFHPGCRTDARRKLGLHDAERILLFVGSLSSVKGVELLVEASAALQRRGVAHRLVLIGSGPLLKSIGEQSRQLGISAQVNFLGLVPQRDLPDWYRAADLFVLASHSEGIPNVLLEAIACDTPFVATRVGGVAEIIELGNGELVLPRRVDLLAAAIESKLQSAPTKSLGLARDHQIVAAEMTSFLDHVLNRFHDRRATVDQPRSPAYSQSA